MPAGDPLPDFRASCYERLCAFQGITLQRRGWTTGQVPWGMLGDTFLPGDGKSKYYYRENSYFYFLGGPPRSQSKKRGS